MVQALTAGGAMSKDMTDLLTPTYLDEDLATGWPAQRGLMVTDAAVADSESVMSETATGVPICSRPLRYLRVVFDCEVVSEHFNVFYVSSEVQPADDAGTAPPSVASMVDGLEDAYRVYDDAGFRMPSERNLVFLSQGMPTGAGISLPSLPGLGARTTAPAIIMDSGENIGQYLAHHELFHQIQYQYIDHSRVIAPLNNPYWWMEATAEWAAHLVQISEPSVTPSSTYAAHLDVFVAGSRGPMDAGGLFSPGGPEYGAFVMAEFLDEEYGDQAVRRTWEAIATAPFGRSPATAIESVVHADDSESYDESLHRFREYMYPLGRAYLSGVGFTDPDAQDDGFWRERLGSGVRPPHESLALSEEQQTASGSVTLASGGAEYLEITGPEDQRGEIEVHVESPGGEHQVSVLQSVGEFPRLCPAEIIWSAVSPGIEDLSEVRDISMTQDAAGTPNTVLNEDPALLRRPVATGALGGGECGNAVVVITNTARTPLVDDTSGVPPTRAKLDWSVTFTPSGTRLDNGTLELGVSRTGVLDYDGNSIKNPEYPMRGTRHSWGISDGIAHAGFDRYPVDSFDEDVVQGTFTFNDTTASSTVQVGQLEVVHDVRPTMNPHLYAVNVTVRRLSGDDAGASNPLIPGQVMYRRTAGWAVGPGRTWFTSARARGGDDSAVHALTYGYGRDPDPYEDPAAAGASYRQRALAYWVYGQTTDVNLGRIPAGASRGVTFYVGVSPTAAAATAALTAAGVDIYTLVENSSNGTDGGPGPVGTFAFKSRLPAPPKGPDPERGSTRTAVGDARAEPTGIAGTP